MAFTSFDENPYESPRADAKGSAGAEPIDEVRGDAHAGQRAVITIISVLIGVSAVTILISSSAGIQDGIVVQFVGLAVLVVQCVFLYRGLLWARIWLLLSLVLACLIDVLLLINGAAIAIIYGLVHVWIVGQLLFSNNIREFLNDRMYDIDGDG